MVGSKVAPSHPYVPSDLQLSDYVPCSLSQIQILFVYAFASIIVFSLTWIVSGRIRKLTKVDRLLMSWWAFTGLTHLILEAYFVFSPEFYKEKTGFYLAEVWKEYSKADSRYAGRDAGVVGVEGITVVFEGPLSLLAVYAIGSRKSYSYILQFAISLGQLYGTVLYFLTGVLQGDNFAINTFYYYAYYIGTNGWWIIIPAIIMNRSWKKISAAVQAQDQTKKTKVR
ncbi:hypothetical protein TanjilG_22310 [Lupinus angustifolius]|uniref:EXPERA domain-containing protein n=1 Tax=Lupinus angustifolius TaxID=3871 RepID=A0A1J7HPI9_LUPAN|nr:PREDICTED: probable 3-beta-hydroxysteroid-Delta(8),Delta(7)-isomerase [Lupinus angustifolius]OIW03653.1 hypothetical protein TanjilG_22310 [Lupinus angustifolius]